MSLELGYAGRVGQIQPTRDVIFRKASTHRSNDQGAGAIQRTSRLQTAIQRLGNANSSSALSGIMRLEQPKPARLALGHYDSPDDEVAMQILQIVLNYMIEEDRLLMQVHGESRTLRVWLARNYVQLLWNTLRDIILAQPHSTLPMAESDRLLMAELMHHRIAEKFDFYTPAFKRQPTGNERLGVAADSAMTSANANSAESPEQATQTTTQGQIALPAPTHMLEDGGFLAYGIKVTWDQKDTPQQKARQLAILPREGDGVVFNLNQDFPHALAHLFIRTCQGTNWGLDLGFSPSTSAGSVVMANDLAVAPRPTLH